MDKEYNQEEDLIIPFVCDECKKMTYKARELGFYFKDIGIVTLRILCDRCEKELRKIQEKIKD